MKLYRIMEEKGQEQRQVLYCGPAKRRAESIYRRSCREGRKTLFDCLSLTPASDGGYFAELLVYK